MISPLMRHSYVQIGWWGGEPGEEAIHTYVVQDDFTAHEAQLCTDRVVGGRTG